MSYPFLKGHGTENDFVVLPDADGALLRPYGHELVKAGDAFTSAAEIGAATAVEVHGRRLVAVAEPTRRGGGSALVVRRR